MRKKLALLGLALAALVAAAASRPASADPICPFYPYHLVFCPDHVICCPNDRMCDCAP
jgi:hypothetical protein